MGFDAILGPAKDEDGGRRRKDEAAHDHELGAEADGAREGVGRVQV